ncbi:unnamed protein product [Ambrosiozyma monospora]|uniref:Unnamed protein product n=1 Tax=Ambrosiozyma monospora TaxID=43982 RepID=A0ACB5TDQ8_AMBMO|nr:unnamed protein product [Ambrosiozyma monospora]
MMKKTKEDDAREPQAAVIEPIKDAVAEPLKNGSLSSVNDNAEHVKDAVAEPTKDTVVEFTKTTVVESTKDAVAEAVEATNSTVVEPAKNDVPTEPENDSESKKDENTDATIDSNKTNNNKRKLAIIEAVDLDMGGHKPKRGRPKKNTSGTAPKNTSAPTPKVASVPAPKVNGAPVKLNKDGSIPKPRGRPRKNGKPKPPAPVNVVVLPDGSVTVPAKRPRGRPRKKPFNFPKKASPAVADSTGTTSTPTIEQNLRTDNTSGTASTTVVNGEQSPSLALNSTEPESTPEANAVTGQPNDTTTTKVKEEERDMPRETIRGVSKISRVPIEEEAIISPNAGIPAEQRRARRGRPRRNPEIISTEIVPKVPRKRGRPPKSKSEPPAKRPRGRPRKYTATGELLHPKTAATPTNESSTTFQVIPPALDDDPNLNQLGKYPGTGSFRLTVPSEVTSDDDLPLTSFSVPVNAPRKRGRPAGVAKKRGRPRKHPFVVPESNVSVAVMPRRSRGRPRGSGRVH